ncbi:toxin-antitoxin system YwqK family antitoxin [Phnomibacter sp. MR]|uniref:toxin-antitoxin system YwqK family antitoxin n=1 Tax=Phnomibacter sp. MR TaxID=3042318 RepID=UPI003A800941
MLRLIIFLLLLQTSVSCEFKESPKGLVIEKNSKGVVISELHYSADSVIDGPAKYYYDNSKLSDSLFYRNGLPDGLHYHYDSIGNLKSIIQYKKGEQDGVASWFYPNGRLQEKGYWRNGDAFGNYYWYLPSGNISSYCFYNFEGKCGYKIDFDSTGHTLREEGRLINQVSFKNEALLPSQEGNPVLLKTGDSLELEIAIATPPIYTSTLHLESQKDDQKLDSHFIDIGDTPIQFKRVFESSGVYNFNFRVEAMDKVKGIQKNEELLILVIVNPK